MSLPVKFCALLFVIASAVPSIAANAALKGVVADSEGAVIPHAHIMVHWDRSGSSVALKSNVGMEKDLRLEADEKGEYEAELPPGFYDVFIYSDAFSPECRKLRIKPGETVTYSPKLKLDHMITTVLGDTFR